MQIPLPIHDAEFIVPRRRARIDTPVLMVAQHPIKIIIIDIFFPTALSLPEVSLATAQIFELCIHQRYGHIFFHNRHGSTRRLKDSAVQSLRRPEFSFRLYAICDIYKGRNAAFGSRN